MRKGILNGLFIAGLGFSNLLGLHANAQDNTLTEEALGSSPFKTWIRSDTNGVPVSIGFTAPVKALNDFEKMASESNPMPEMSIAFPERRGIPFSHLYFLWNPHGHEPPQIYGLPHYDIHFYILPETERLHITCTGSDEAICMKQPPSGAIPPHYDKTPAGVPKMGWHYVDLLSPEFHGHPFTSTLIYGYYDGRMAFLEPMVTKAFLETHPQFIAPIRQPAQFPQPGYYPTTYRVRYLPVADAYEFSLSHFIYRH